MSLFTEFKSLSPYLQSIRKLKQYIVFDLTFPKNWKILKKFIIEDKFLEQESNDSENRLLTFVSDSEESSVNTTVKNIQNIIKYNLEREQKEQLLQEKITELQQLFEKNTLKNLMTLKFDIKIPKNNLNNGEGIETLGLVREGEE